MDALISPRRRRFIAALGSASLLAACGESRPRAGGLQFGGPAMGSSYTVNHAGSVDDALAARAADAVREAIARVEARMSTWLPDSELARFKRQSAGVPIGFSAET